MSELAKAREVGTFGERLAAQFAAGNHLCVGIDPHKPLLASWGVDDSPAGLEHFGREVVAAAATSAGVACIKPQVAFFERHGAKGFAALERILADARAARLLVIADCKRGDIGSSFAAYAESWLAPGSPLESDAMTAHPYHGVGSLSGAHEFLSSCGKGLFVLAATSNPEARESQQAQLSEGKSVAAAVVDEVASWNREIATASASSPEAAATPTVGQVGVVLGATLDLAEFGIDTASAYSPVLPVLAPGFGAQGARLDAAAELFASLGAGLLANVSRSVLAGGASELPGRIARAAAELGGGFAGTAFELSA